MKFNMEEEEEEEEEEGERTVNWQWPIVNSAE